MRITGLEVAGIAVMLCTAILAWFVYYTHPLQFLWHPFAFVQAAYGAAALLFLIGFGMVAVGSLDRPPLRGSP